MRLPKISVLAPVLALPFAVGAVTALPTAADAASCSTISYTNPYLGFPVPVPAAMLSSGSTGPCVVILQQELNSTINAKLSVDGIFGAKTLSAVRTYQSEDPSCTGGTDGIAGHNTMSCLQVSSSG